MINFNNQNLESFSKNPGLSPSVTGSLPKNIDMVFVRELTGGIYFGEKKITDRSASDICEYSKEEIERITRVAAIIAQNRRKKITSVDKANVPARHRVWPQNRIFALRRPMLLNILD